MGLIVLIGTSNTGFTIAALVPINNYRTAGECGRGVLKQITQLPIIGKAKPANRDAEHSGIALRMIGGSRAEPYIDASRGRGLEGVSAFLPARCGEVLHAYRRAIEEHFQLNLR